MNNKELFNAINNIDDEFVNDAGKYLNAHLDDETVEIRPIARKTSPIKIIAPIAAAVAVICGVTLVTRTQLFTRPNGANTTSGGTSSLIEPASETVTSDANEPAINIDELEVYGPDGKQITSDDVKSITPVGKYREVWVCDFAYYTDSKGTNYNPADYPYAFSLGTFSYKGNAWIEKLRVGDFYRSGSVTEAYSTFVRDTESGAFSYSGSHLKLSSLSWSIPAYLVKSGDEYYCLARNGARGLPLINIKEQEDGKYRGAVSTGNISGLEYKNEICPIHIGTPMKNGKDISEFLDKFFAEKSYYKANICFSEFTMDFDANGDIMDISGHFSNQGAEICNIQFDNGEIDNNFVVGYINILDPNRRGNPEIKKLKSELMDYFGFTDVRVFSEIDSYGDELEGTELTEGKLAMSSVVAVYDENGLCGLYDNGQLGYYVDQSDFWNATRG